MAFKSQVFTHGNTNLNGAKATFVRFRVLSNNSSGGSFSKAVGLHGKRVDIQIDEESKRIRCKEHPDGNKVSEKAGLFGINKSAVIACGKERIYLTLSDDGWWYGSYDSKEDSCAN